jgi:hypothetical protein
MMRRSGLIVVALAVMSNGAAGLQTGRPSPGTATISGVVIDDHTGQPIRYAEAMLSTAGGSLVSRVNTDDAGRFRFDRLEAGAYVLYLGSSRYLQTQYGAAKTGGRGRLIEVGEGARVDGIVARLTPGAVIEGTIRTGADEPLANAAVQFWQWGYLPITGERALAISDYGGGVHTDDRGRYRAYQMAPGEYFVSTTGFPLRIDGPIPVGQEPIPLLTHEQIEAMRRGQPAAARPHEVRTPTYFPGVTRAAEAEVVTVAAGQERSGVDFTMRVVPTSVIRGRVVAPAGVKPVRTLMMLRSASGEAEPRMPAADRNDGTFLVTAVPPGEYTLTASMYLQADLTPGATSLTDPEPRLFGVVSVTVAGNAASDVVIPVQPGGVISGRVQFAGPPPSPEVLNRVRIATTWAGTGYPLIAPPSPAPVRADGTFTLASVPPGPVVLRVTTAGSGDLQVASAIVNGVDIADIPFEMNGQQLDGVVVTMSAGQSTLSGTVRQASGELAGDGWVVVFSTDRATWRPLSRRVAGAQVTADGRYTIAGLPRGEYFILALPDVAPSRWFDASFLQQLQAMSPARIALADGEKKVQPLVMSR